tara:strand:+ start:17840 stop:18586 length:747 start_codon:yes stop_codon:yes gene_type:complete
MKALGIDIGGSGIKGALVDTLSGELATERFRLETPTPSSPEAILPLLEEIVKKFQHSGVIGCGFPGVIAHKKIQTAANLDKHWIGTNLGQQLKEKTNCPTCVLNDADAAGLAEVRWGAGKDNQGTVLMITLGTGLGTALFKAGHLYPNVEMGRILLNNGKEAESWASSANRKEEDLSWETWASRLNEYLSLMEAYLQPDLIILGGGVAKKAEKFLPLLNLSTEVVPAKLLNHAGIIGAAAHAQAIYEQ